MPEKLQSVRGMNDLLPADIGVWHRVEAALRAAAWAYGYQEIRTPVVERAALFTQSIGDSSDIVQKEMYAFTDAGGDELALRPEATASTVRACNQHGLLHNRQQRLWYLGPMFRRERPQKGRYRQFHQFGLEAFGWAGPDIDAEVIRVGQSIWRRLGIGDGEVELQLNTLGSPTVAAAYRDALRAYFAGHRDQLDADSARRLEVNPLRILDSKAPAMQELIECAPDILAFLDAPAVAHFDALCDSLRAAGVKYAVNPRLVRGLDYYTATVFEWVAADQLGAQNAVCAGGRYDNLVATRGGRPTPAVGFALGLERLVALVGAGDGDGDGDAGGMPEIYVCAGDGDDAAAQAVAVAERLRADGFTVAEHRGGGKLAKQLRRASVSGAALAVIAGLPGAAPGTVQAKPLRGQGGESTVGVDALSACCRRHLT